MPVSSADRSQATVFISYAHESDALREQVKALADWLTDRGCTVLTDHPHQYRPPAEGWQAWMLRCIDEAATVLVICTPKLKLRYEKNEEPDTGRGATYEGAIVTQHIYDNAMRNTKFFPILPDGGSYEDIPHTLRSWSNNHRVPSGNKGILHMIREGYAAEGSHERGQTLRDIDATPATEERGQIEPVMPIREVLFTALPLIVALVIGFRSQKIWQNNIGLAIMLYASYQALLLLLLFIAYYYNLPYYRFARNMYRLMLTLSIIALLFITILAIKNPHMLS